MPFKSDCLNLIIRTELSFYLQRAFCSPFCWWMSEDGRYIESLLHNHCLFFIFCICCSGFCLRLFSKPKFDWVRVDVLNKHKKADLKAACIEIDQERWFVNSYDNGYPYSLTKAVYHSTVSFCWRTMELRNSCLHFWDKKRK